MTTKPRTYNADLAHLPAALVPLTEEHRWVVWPWELRVTKNGKEKWTKPPRQARDPRRNARSNDPSTWGSYSDAVAAVAAGNADGIGYMLKDSNIGAIDLDHCVDQESTKLDSWAEQLCGEANGAYQEITVSGGGLRIMGTVSGPETHRKFTFDRTTGAGIELYRNTARYITISGAEIGEPCAELPPLDAFIDTLFARHNGHAAGGLDFNDADPQAPPDYDDLIRNGAPDGQRSEAFQSVVWHLAGRGWTVEAILHELAKHPAGIGAKYADRLFEEVTRSYDKWHIQKRRNATGEPVAGTAPWPQIYVVKGELPRVVNEAEAALIDLGREIYQRGGQIVRPILQRLRASDDRETQGWQLIPVTAPDLGLTLTCAARFFKFDARGKNWVPTDAPGNVTEAYLASAGRWKLPVLTGITGAPFLRPDNSLCEAPGYDAATGLLYKPACTFPPVPAKPTKDDAKAALELLESLIGTFPFITPADRTVALAAILTALDRHSMESAPLFAFTAPTAGTGKSKLVDIVSVLATGHLASVTSQGNSEQELEKRLGAELLAGSAIVSIDNCEHPLESAFLCSVLTQQTVNVRILGQSKQQKTPSNATIFATGNNLTIVGDLTRRTLLCSMDAECEHPEQREFDCDAVDIAKARRGELVTAALTVLKAWHLSGAKGTKPFGSFETWSHRIRDALLWLGCDDPCDTIHKVKGEDPQVAALTAVMAQWHEHIGLQREVTVQEVINHSLNAHDFFVALMNVAAAKSGNVISNDRLGRWLKKNEARIISSVSLRCTGVSHGHSTWKLVR